MRPRLLIVTDRYPIDPDRSPAAWMLEHLRALGTVADIEVVSLIRLFPRIKNLFFGGYDRRWYRAVAALPALAQPFPHVTVHHRRCVTVPDAMGWKVNPLLLRRQQAAWMTARARAFRPDALLVHYVHASAPLARSVARAVDVPLWIDENETIAAMPDEGQRDLSDWIRAELKRADAVLAQCAEQEQELRALLPPGVIHRIPLGIVGGRPAADAPAPPPFELICVSRLDLRAKHVDRLLHAIARLHGDGMQDVRLTIAGDGYLRREFETLVRYLRIDDVVRFAGWMAPEELRKLLARAHAAVQPAQHESFGLVALEAAAAGLPLVAGAHAGVVPDLAAAGAAVLPLDAITPEVIAEAILELRMRYDEYRRQAIEARGRILETYSWSAHARLYAALLRPLRQRT